MGIRGLTKLLSETAPTSIKENKLKNYFSRKIAIDANMAMYQFLIGYRSSGMDLADDTGEVTSHLSGLLYRTAKLLEIGIKPIYVFDGDAPLMKSEELQKRKEKREAAIKELEEAKETADEEMLTKLSKRVIRVSREQCDEGIKLLKMLGIPAIRAAGEAEAQCAAMATAGKVYGTATEDTDALTFGTPRLLRHLTGTEGIVKEFDLEEVLKQLEISMDQFIDICILCTCDYCNSIRGIGPKKALQFIKQHGSIEGVIEFVKDQKAYVVPEQFDYKQARAIFKKPAILPVEDIKLNWKEPDEEKVVAFLCGEKKFQEERVRRVIQRIRKARKKGTQKRLTNFFQVAGTTKSSTLVKAEKEKEALKKVLKSKKGVKRKRPAKKGGAKAPPTKKKRYTF